jgi:hypothetical protein
MSRFYGTLQGNRGEATRAGSADSGLQSYTASWQGAVYCHAFAEGDQDRVSVKLTTWHGRGASPSVYLYLGSIGPGQMEALQGQLDAMLYNLDRGLPGEKELWQEAQRRLLLVREVLDAIIASREAAGRAAQAEEESR